MTAPLVRKITLDHTSVATGADVSKIFCVAPFSGAVTDVTFVPNAAATGGVIANSRIYSVINRGQTPYTGTVPIASIALTTSGPTDFVDNTPKALTLATSANLLVSAGDVIEFESLHRTTGQNDPGGQAILTLSRS